MEGTLLLCRALDNHNLCYRSFPWNGFPSAFPFPQIIGCGVGGREILRDPCGSRYGHRRVHDRLCPFVLLWFFLWQFIHVRNFVVDHSTWFRWGRFGRRCWWRRRRRLVSWASAPLLCGDSLYPKRIASRPTHFILAFAVRANCTSLDVLPESGGSNDAHAPLALLTTKDFLQCCPPCLTCSARRSPPDPVLLHPRLPVVLLTS